MGRLVLGLTSRLWSGSLALLLGLAIALLLHGRFTTPPVYDSISVPTEPYRYVSPPPGTQGNQQPSAAQVTVAVRGGHVAAGSLATDDNQVAIYWLSDTFGAQGSTSLSCRIDPVRDPPSAPAGLEIRGNVYRITCAAANGEPVSAAAFDLTMRLPPGETNDLRYYDGSHWHVLPTFFGGPGDPYAGTHAPAFGLYAAMARIGAPTSDNLLVILARNLELFGLVGLVVIFAAIAFIQELRRRRRIGLKNR